VTGSGFWHHVVQPLRAAMMVMLLDEQDRVLLLWRHGWRVVVTGSSPSALARRPSVQPRQGA
jgi:hypothetical protein